MLRSRSVARGLVPALALFTAVLAACNDERVTTPTARAGAPLAAVNGDAVTLAPGFTVIDTIRGGFQETFTHIPDPNTPAHPKPWQPANWSIVRHQRDPKSWYAVDTMMAWHGSMCQKPDDKIEPTHRVASYDGTYDSMMFLCRNHMMTANNSSGYGVVYMTPDRMVDFTNEAVVRFDVATMRESGRDWIDLWLTPYADNLVTPLEDSLPDLQGEPRRAVHVRMTDTRTRSAFRASVVRDFVSAQVPSATDSGYEAAFAARGLTTSATRRDTFELHISRTRIKFGMPRYNLWWVDTTIADLGWSQGVLQIGHHSFNPTAEPGGMPSSWHWDNIGMQPAVPFTILRADRRFVDDTSTDEVVFPRGAPAGAYLRFSALRATDVRFMRDARVGDKGWSAASRQAQKHDYAERFASYWMPVPEGTTRVRFRRNPARPRTTAGPWMARDISIWADPQITVMSGNNKDKAKHLDN